MDENTYNPDVYLPTIDAILSVADLEKITVKKIRNALQELFGINLVPHKKDINEKILNRYYDMVDRRAKDERTEKQRLQEISKLDAFLAAKLLKESNRSSRTKKKVTTPKKKSSERVPSKNGFNKEMALSPELQNVVGQDTASRPQVVLLIWKYIKDNSLQNPSDKRQILCDEKLEMLFKKKMVGAFDMNKILSKHIFKPEELTEDTMADEITESLPHVKDSESEEE